MMDVSGSRLLFVSMLTNARSPTNMQRGVNEMIDWLQAEYDSIFEDGSGVMKVHRGKVNKYLGMS
jgi:hypothetical protein